MLDPDVLGWYHAQAGGRGYDDSYNIGNYAQSYS